MLFTNFRKYFLVFMCTSIIAPIYSMEKDESESLWSRILKKVPVIGGVYNGLQKQKLTNKLVAILEQEKIDITELELLLKDGARPNAYKYGLFSDLLEEVPLLLAVNKGHIDAIKLLLKFGADINYIDLDYGKFALGEAVKKNKIKVIKVLCNEGASLKADRPAGSIFHKIVMCHGTSNLNLGYTKKYIKAIMTHASCFDDTYEYGEKEEKDIIMALLVFKKLNINFHNDIKFLILEKISPRYCFSKIFEKVSNQAKQRYAFKQVCQRVKGIQRVLQICDNNNKTALQELLKSDYTDECKQKLKPLLDGSKLEEDLERFEEEFPNTNSLLKDNLALVMCNNILKLLESKNKK